MNTRIEHDTMGEIAVPADHHWGAQTQRSFENFKIGGERQPKEIITAFAYLKEACARANAQVGKLTAEHGAVLRAHRIEMILLVRDAHHLLKIRGIRSHIHKRKLKADAGIKEVQEAAPFLKDGRLIFLLCQLVIDILKLDCLCIIIKPYTADTIRKHPVKRNALLCRLRYAIIFPGVFYDLPYCHLVCPA